jgi:hypothetical protein
MATDDHRPGVYRRTPDEDAVMRTRLGTGGSASTALRITRLNNNHTHSTTLPGLAMSDSSQFKCNERLKGDSVSKRPCTGLELKGKS